jgi:predicted ABC-type ATPase
MDSTHKPTLCVVAGPNGSGKTSTTVQLLANEWLEGSLYINPNNIAQEQFGDWNSPEAVLKAARYATDLRYKCLNETRDFVFETVFSSDEKLEFLRKAHNQGSVSVSSLSAQVIQKSTYHASQKDTLKVGMKSQYQRLYHDTTSLM